MENIPITIPYVIDLDDHEGSGIPTLIRYHANGEREEEMSPVMDGEGPHGLFNVTDTVMCKMPTGVTPEEASKMAHLHAFGYETFFVDSGSMYLYTDGKRTIVKTGDIVHLQPGQMHAMASIEDVKWRGFFHDLDSFDDGWQSTAVTQRIPSAADDPAYQKARGARDFLKCEQPVYRDVPPEEMGAVRNPARPLATYAFDGMTAKILIPRWDNGGVTECTLAEMKAGFTFRWGYHPTREQYYVRSGKVKLTVFGEEYIAGKACLVNVPKLAPFSLKALEDAEVYDMGGQTRWFAFLQDYESVRTYDPARLGDKEAMQALKDKYGIPLESMGME